MLVKTKLFGEVDLEESKILTFKDGIIGFEDLKKFAILYDLDNDNNHNISWLQSLDEPALAFPVLDPFLVKGDYNPSVPDDLLEPLGEIVDEKLSLLVTLSVPKDIKKMSCNIKAPFVINTETRLGAQIIADNADYPVKYYIYDQLQDRQKAKGEC